MKLFYFIILLLLYITPFLSIKYEISNGIAVNLFDVILIMLSMHFYVIVKFDQFLYLLKINKYILIYFVISIIESFLFLNIENSISPLFKLFESIMILLIIQYLYLVGNITYSNINKVIEYGSIVIVLLLLLSKFLGQEDSFLGGNTGFVMIVPAIIFFEKLITKKKINNLLVFLLYFTFALFFSKRTFVAIGVILFAIIFFMKITNSKQYLISLFFLLITGYIIIFIINSIFIHEIASILETYRYKEIWDSLVGGDVEVANYFSRLNKWNAALSQITSSENTLMFGVGYGNIDCGITWLGVGNKNPDNIYIRVLGHTGAIGLFFFIAFYLSLLKKGQEVRDKMIIFFIILTGFFWANIIGFTIMYHSFFISIILIRNLEIDKIKRSRNYKLKKVYLLHDREI